MNLTTYLTGGLALAVAVCYGLYAYEAKKVERREALIAAHQAVEAVAARQIEEAKAMNEGNQAALAALEQEVERQKALAVKAERTARARDASLKQALKRIADAPLSEDGPIAPVLKRELDGLRTDPVAGSTGSPGSSDPDPSDAIPALDRSDVPPAPPAS